MHPAYPVSTPPADSVQGAYVQPSLLLSQSEEAALSSWLGFCMHRSREELISAYLISPSGIHASVALWLLHVAAPVPCQHQYIAN